MSAAEWFTLLGIVLCLIAVASLWWSEATLTLAARASIARLEKQGNARAKTVNRLLAGQETLIRVLMAGRVVAIVMAAALASASLHARFGASGVVLAMVATAIVIVFVCVLTTAVSVTERATLAAATPVHLLVRLIGPVLVPFEITARWLLGLAGIRVAGDLPVLTSDALRGGSDHVRRGNDMEKQNRDMLGGLLELRELTVSDVMIHRTEMVTINAGEAVADVVRAMLTAPVTRVPLWLGSPENIVGILHAKDLLRAIQNARGDLDKLDITAIARPPWFVPDIRPLDEQLRAFRRRRTPFALVVDEYGEVMGLVTLEDIIGEITDEHDRELTGVRPQPDGSVVVHGGVPIRDLNRTMDWQLPDEEATTVAGLVIHEAQSIPEPGQSFTFHGFRFRVLRRNRNRITALRITPLLRLAQAKAS